MIAPLLDANILLHGRKVVDIPWAEIETEEVRVIIVGPTLREVEKFKTKPGRVGKRARDVSSELREMLKLPGRSKIVREAKPRVSMTVVPGIGVKSPLHPSLDLANPDQALVNHGLALVEEGVCVQLLTDDTLASLIAEEAGLPAILVPDHWMLGAEPDETEKKLKRAEAEIIELKKQEPRLSVTLLDADGGPLPPIVATIRRYPLLSPEEIDELIGLAKSTCPPSEDFGPRTAEEATAEEERRRTENPLHVGSVIASVANIGVLRRVFEPAGDEEIEAYRNEAYPAWLKRLRGELGKLARSLDACVAWPVFKLVLANEGTRPADGALVEVIAHGRIRIGRVAPPKEDEAFSWSFPAPPEPPRGGILKQKRFGNIMGAAHVASFMSEPRVPALPLQRLLAPLDPTKFSWSPKLGEMSTRVAGQCSTWRHQSDARTVRLFVDTLADIGAVDGAIEVRISANNLSKVATVRHRVDIAVETGDTYGVARTLIGDLGRHPPR